MLLLRKSIVFRIWKFPGFCETFLLNQIITADQCGLYTRLMVEDIENLKSNPHKRLIDQIGIDEKVIIENYGIPKTKIAAYLKAAMLILIHLNSIGQLYGFLKSQKFFQTIDIFKFFFLIKLNKFDIIHVQYGTNVKPLEMLKKHGSLKSKIIVSFHGHDLHFPINGRIFEKDYYNEIFQEADLLVPTTGYLYSLLIKLGAPKEKIKTVPVGVDTNIFYPDKKKKRSKVIKLITVGRMDELKGQKYGIEVVKNLKKLNYDFEYTLVGTGSHMKVLQEMVTAYGLDEQVKFLGEKSQSEVRDLLQLNDIFLMTSVKGAGNSREGQGLVTAEAQACGLPVVAFDSGGVKYTIENNKTGFLVPEKNTLKMTFELEKLLQNHFLREKMGRKAVEFIANKFSQKKVSEQWCEIYRTI